MDKRLSPQQIQAIEYLKQPGKGGMTNVEIAQAVGVTKQTLYNWLNKEYFYEELKRQIVKDTAHRLPDVLESIPDHIIKDGNASMLRTFLQMHGLMPDKSEVIYKHENQQQADTESLKDEIARFKAFKKTGDE